MDLKQQLLSFGFQRGISRLGKLVCFLESQNVGRIEDDLACISRSCLLPLAYIAGGPRLVGSAGSGSIIDCDLAFLNKVCCL